MKAKNHRKRWAVNQIKTKFNTLEEVSLVANDQQWKDKVIWITGASSGIGEAVALGFSRLGAKVVLSARNENELKRVANDCGNENCLVLPLDVTKQDSMEAAVTRVKDSLGSIDLLFNNAGISQRSTALETDMETYRTIFEVDVFGQIALTKAVLPVMIEQSSGHIVVTASVAGKMGVPFRTGYCAAKHAVMGFFDALRSEVAHQGISVSTVVPGFIKTNISANAVAGDGSKFGGADRDISGGMSAEACAQIIIDGLSKGKPEIPVGDGMEMHALWIKRFFPKLLNKLMVKQFKKRADAIGKKA